MKRALAAVIAAFAVAAFVAGCSGGGGSGGANNNQNTVSFQVSPPSGSTLPNGTVGAVYTQTFTVLSGGTGPYSFGGVGLPGGLTITQLTPTACALSGTPTQSGTGVLQFQIQDSASHNEVEQYALTILGGANSLTVSPATLTGSFVAGQPFSNALSTTGTAPITWTFQGTLPNGINLGSSQGATNTLSGTFTRSGTFSFSINTMDATGATGKTSYNVTVQ